MEISKELALEADYAVSLHPVETGLHDSDEQVIDWRWGWTGWQRRFWPADIVKPGLLLYKFDLRPDKRELCELLKLSHGGSFSFGSMEEFVDQVFGLIGKRPDPNDEDDSRRKWAEIEHRLIDCETCTGLCYRWQVVKRVSISLRGKFPQLGWCKLRESRTTEWN